MIPTDARRLQIYVNGRARAGGKPLYQAIVEKARSAHLAGASVFPVEISFGASGEIHDTTSEYAFCDVPVLIELIDAPDRIGAFADELGVMLTDGVTMIEPVRVIRYGRPINLASEGSSEP
jgi:PII-like signaling protein